MEMSAFVRQPGLHATFIERYNALWHLRLALAASFLVAGIVNLVATCGLAVRACPQNQCFPVVIGCLVGLVSILFVVAGAIEHGLPPRYVERLARVPAVPDPNAARAARARRLLDGSGVTRGHHAPTSALNQRL